MRTRCNVPRAPGGDLDARQIAEALDDAKRQADGSWMACCPVHKDSTPSLHLSDNNGKVLVHCFADCRKEKVIDALRDRELWPGPHEPPPKAGPKPGQATEHAAALEFTRRHRETMRFDHGRGRWYEWASDRWRHDRKRLAFDYAHRIAAEFNVKAPKQASVQRAMFAAGVDRFAQADPAHAVEAGFFDSDPWLMGVPGGTLDVKTQQVITPDPSHRISLQAAVAPADAADCPRWMSFLQETFGDADLIGLIQRFMGYSLTGDTREQAMAFGQPHTPRQPLVVYPCMRSSCDLASRASVRPDGLSPQPRYSSSCQPEGAGLSAVFMAELVALPACFTTLSTLPRKRGPAMHSGFLPRRTTTYPARK